jgi:hydroxysqualene dehydroxylase
VTAPSHIHVIGAGLAGLSAAVRFAGAGHTVTVYEAAGHAGGRCRSFHDAVLDRVIDNGNHLLLSGNHAAMSYLDVIDARDGLIGPSRAAFAFFDLEHNLRWEVKPDRGAVPWSVFCSHRRVPGSTVREHLAAWRLARAGPEQTVGDCLPVTGELWRRFWKPVVVSILNTEPSEASAQLLWAVLKQTFGKGEAACRPLIAAQGLSETFVTPALRYLKDHGVDVKFNQRIREIAFEEGRAVRLKGSDTIELGAGDSVIIATPPTAACQLLPGMRAPDVFQPIVNGHFRVDRDLGEATFMGLVGGTAEWLFVRGDVVSTTVSAAAELAVQSEAEIAASLWADIQKALELGDMGIGTYRIIKEKRATFEQTPGQVARRPDAMTSFSNLVLAGDWTDTGLPATIEGTIRSGMRAAELLSTHVKNP